LMGEGWGEGEKGALVNMNGILFLASIS